MLKKIFSIVIALIAICSIAKESELEASQAKLIRRVKKEYKGATDQTSLATLELLEKEDCPAAAALLYKLATSRKTPTHIANRSAEILSLYESDESIKMVTKTIKAAKSYNKYTLQVAVNLNIKGCRRIYEQFMIHKDPTVAVSAIRGIEAEGNYNSKVVRNLSTLIKPGNRAFLRKKAAEVFGNIPTTNTFKVLLLYVTDIDIQEQVQNSLMRITGESSGKSKNNWLSFAKSKGKGFASSLKNESLEDFEARMDEIKEAQTKEVENGENGENVENIDESFYGIPIDGRKILFVLDRSGSMSAPASRQQLPEDYDGGMGEAANRIEVLKFNLKNMIQNLPSTVEVGLIFFGHPEVHALPEKGLLKLTKANRSKIIKFIDEITATGGTPMGKAMQYAFEKTVAKYDVETLYLLSDGYPTTPPEELRKKIMSYNNTYYLKINTVGIGVDSQLLKNIAEDGNGTYRFIK